METYPVIALNVSHIEKADDDALRIAAFQTNIVMERDSGFFIKLYMNDLADNLRGDFSPSLCKVIQFAFNYNFDWIELDSDAEAISELDQHAW
ncbi:hypothetical protein [Methylophaga sp.]|uniref:DUF5983 family protein n=1 Tax=Methylophaga sp. TaxID=2024840 RepID=UPI000C0F9EB1|nr:hypothetical protein [Methylophaga sp.]MBL1456388.1 hypothetical protein [Methylophaga sp.]